ncbi:MAG: EI24 domain-containing protein [Parafilimonas sp.]
MLKEIIIALQSYYKAHYFIREHKLWKWIIIPGIIYAILFTISMYFFGITANSFIEWISLKTGLKIWLAKNGTGITGFLFAFAGVMLWITQMLFYFSLFKYIWLILGSPVFAYLSEKTASIIEEKEFEFNSKQYTKDIVRGIKIALRNCLWQSVYMISILLLSLIPVAGWLTPLLALLVECYYYGFSMLDYSFERKKFTTAESIYFIGDHKGLAVGNGVIFYLIHVIPVLGWVLAPAYSVVAATLSLHDMKELIPVKAE